MACERLLSTIGAQMRPDTKISWIPWHKIVSESAHERILKARAAKRPLPGAGMPWGGPWQDQPVEHEPMTSCSKSMLERMQEIRRNAYAAMGWCHVGYYKIFDYKFKGEAFDQRVDTGAGMRLPSAKEIMWADEEIHKRMYKLISPKTGRTFDHVLHEFTENRQDIYYLLLHT